MKARDVYRVCQSGIEVQTPQNSIQIGGHDITSLNLGALRKCFGYVSQDTILFSKSLEANVAFGRKVFAWDGGIYTLEIPLSNMADLDRMRTQEAAMSAGDSTLAREVIHHIDTSIQQRRPELSFTPNTPRVPEAEVGFYRGITFNLKFGTANEASEIFQQIRALYEENNVENEFAVFSKVTGSFNLSSPINVKINRVVPTFKAVA